MKWSKEDRAYLRSLIKAYLIKIPDATPEEKAELKVWVMSGHDPYDNPYSVWGENGLPLDYISALRFWRDFEPSGKNDKNFASVEGDIDPFRGCNDSFAEEPPKQT